MSARQHPLFDQLRGGDLRSIGRADEVARRILKEPALLAVLIDGMSHAEPLIRMRASDAAEKVSAARPEWFHPYRDRLLGTIAEIEQQEVRWHVAQILPRLELDPPRRQRAFALLLGYLEDASKIVVASALEALAHLAREDRKLAPQVFSLIKEGERTGSAAIRARCRKLLAAWPGESRPTDQQEGSRRDRTHGEAS